MKVKIKPKYIVLFLVIIAACKKVANQVSLESNKPPVAVVQPDINISLPVDSAVLNGTSSYDPDGKIVSFAWLKIAGPASL